MRRRLECAPGHLTHGREILAAVRHFRLPVEIEEPGEVEPTVRHTRATETLKNYPSTEGPVTKDWWFVVICWQEIRCSGPRRVRWRLPPPTIDDELRV